MIKGAKAPFSYPANSAHVLHNFLSAASLYHALTGVFRQCKHSVIPFTTLPDQLVW